VLGDLPAYFRFARYSNTIDFVLCCGGMYVKDGDGVLPGRLQGAQRVGGGGFAIVDVEATGSSSRRHRVVEVAVVLLGEDCSPQGEFTTLVDPQGPVGPSHIHGIEDHQLKRAKAPRFAEVAPGLLGLLRGRVLVGHNVGCDRAFLAAEYARLGVLFPTVPEVCTMRLAALCDPAPAGLSLRACAVAAGMTGWPAHTALGDARATARLFVHYAGECPQGGKPGAEHTEAALARAAVLQWPRMMGSGAPWVRREENVPVRQIVSYSRNGSA
jgi:DNA polymerase-3 subunit epsilon